jgi:hypothetical protein
MATKKVLIQVILNDKASKQIKKTGDEVQKLSSKVTILNKEQKQQIINDEKSAIQKKNLINELKAQAAAEMNVVAAQKQGRAQSGLNNAILLETGRLASDASYGFTAIANNLSQVVTLFSSFAETNGGVVASMKELGKSLWGMGGILIGIQLLISFGPKILDFFTGMDEAAKKAAKSQKELADSLNDLNANIVVSEEYIKVIEDVNTTEEERENIIKELIKLIPDLKEEDFKYGDNLDKVKEKINEYAIAQASRIETDKLVQDNSELLAKRRKINLINEIEDDEERLKAIKQFAKEEGFTQKLQQQQFGVYKDLTEKDNNEYINIFESRSKAVIGESDTILDKIRELTDTSFLGGKGDDGKALQDKYDKEFEELNKFLTKQEALEQIYFDSKLTDEQIEINKVRDKYFKFIDMAKGFGFDTSLLEKARQSEIDAIKKKFSDKELEEEEKKQQQLQKIRDKYQLGKLKIEEDTLDDPETQDELAVFEEKQLARVAKEEELAILALDKLKLSTEDKEKAITDIENYYAAVRLKNKEENQKTSEKIDDLETKSKLEALDNIGKGIMAASEIAGKSTGVGKALAVAGTLVSTYSAAQKAYESQLVPLDPTSKGRAIIAAAKATISGLANVRAIMAVKSPAMKETSAVTGGQGNVQVQAPDFNVVGQGGVNQLGQVIGAQFGQPIRAYVVSGDISSAQELDRSITAGATID